MVLLREKYKPVTTFEPNQKCKKMFISNRGNVKRISKYDVVTIKKGYVNKEGYCMTSVNGHTKGVHVLVALHFIGPPGPEDKTVDHIDRDPLNNSVKNLRWSTISANQKNRVRKDRL